MNKHKLSKDLIKYIYRILVGEALKGNREDDGYYTFHPLRLENGFVQFNPDKNGSCIQSVDIGMKTNDPYRLQIFEDGRITAIFLDEKGNIVHYDMDNQEFKND